MDTGTLSLEQLLLRRIADGDEKALSEMIRKYTGHIYGFAITYLHRPELVEEVCQDVFTKVWTTRERLPEVESLKDYLFIIARNTTFSALRKSLNKEPVDFATAEYAVTTADDAPDRKLEIKQYEALLNEAVANLPEKRRQVFLLSRQQGLTRAEICEELGISAGTVNDHLTRALNFVRQYVAAKQNGDLLILFLVTEAVILARTCG